MDKNKFMQQHSAHNQGLCLKCIYKKRLSWRMFLLVVDIFFHILKAHLIRQTPSHDLTAVLMTGIKGKNNDSSEFHSMTSSHAGEYLLISSRQSICRNWLWWCCDAENAPLWLSRCVAQQRNVVRTLAGTDLKAEALHAFKSHTGNHQRRPASRKSFRCRSGNSTAKVNAQDGAKAGGWQETWGTAHVGELIRSSSVRRTVELF